MAKQVNENAQVQLDLSDVDPRVGQPTGAGQLWEPCSATDIRRWVHALDYANPIHWNQEFARNSKFGGIVAPQSCVVAMDYGHGAPPACVGKIPGSHLIFGGEEWWFYGPRIKPGDILSQKRRFHGYKVTNTSFAGPTMFSMGDTFHTNQHGTPVAKERSTAIRYLAEEANKRGMFKEQLKPIRRWTAAERAEIAKVRLDWILSNRLGISPHFEEVHIGDKLPRRVIGPHNVATFTCEYRAFIFDAWGSWHWVIPDDVEDPWTNQDAGFLESFTFDDEAAKIDPRMRDGLFEGPSRGHIDESKAEEIGMFRAYGYGATMGAWTHDYVAYWAGHDGYIRHSKSQFRTPAFEGDVTYFEGEVIGKNDDSLYGMPTVVIEVKLTNQDGDTLVNSTLEVEVPHSYRRA
jgi:acyl dehydratase